MDYWYNKYLKYKTKYNQLKGGIYKLNELEFEQQKYENTNPQKFKYVAGPNDFIILQDSERTVYLFGERHTVTTSFNCGPDDENETIYLTEYLHRMLQNEKKHIDIFLEIPVRKFSLLSLDISLLTNVEKQFGDCFGIIEERSIQEKKECRKKYEKHRFHMCDIRRLEYDMIKQSEMTQLMTIITSIGDLYEINSNVIIEKIIEIIDITGTNYKHSFLETIEHLLDDSNKSNNVITVNMAKKYYGKLFVELKDFSNKINNEEIKNIIENKYLRYFKIAAKYNSFFNFCEIFLFRSSPDLFETALEIIIDKMIQDSKFIKNIPSYEIINKLKNVYISEEGGWINSSYIELNQYLIDNGINKFDNDTFNKGGNILSFDKLVMCVYPYALGCESLVMDSYLLGRMFKNYKDDKFGRNKAINNIVLVGARHINIYAKVLKDMNFNIKFMTNGEKCIEMPEKLRKFEFVEKLDNI